MKKGLFLVFHGFAAYNGISKKISYQIDAFRQCGIKMDLCNYDVTDKGERVWKIESKTVLSFGFGTLAKLKKRVCYKALSDIIIKEKYDFVYIRSMHNANPFTIDMVKRLKRAGLKVLMEIPTYPYDQEYIYFKMKIDLFFDKCFRHALAKNLDRIVTFSDFDTIFGCSTIRISNGVDFEHIKMKNKINDTSKSINLIGVAEIHYWHGFDRLIKGLSEYYKEKPEYLVYFHLIGDFFGSREREEILTPIKENNLDSFVILYGNRQGTELDELFEKCDMGVGSLARHRSGIDNIKTLKNREYAARGIPFVYSETDSDFDTMPYVLKIPADESPVSISSIIDFYKDRHFTPLQIRESINFLSWECQMKIVLNEIESL